MNSLDPAGTALPGAGTPGAGVAGQAADGGAAAGAVRPNAAAGGAATDAAVRGPPALTDVLEIQPLDAAGALRILVAEVQSELDLLGPPDRPDRFRTPGQINAWPLGSLSPEIAAQSIIRSLLRVVGMVAPDSPAMPGRRAAAGQAETGLCAGLDRGVDLVGSWHDVSAATLQAALDLRAMVLRQMVETPPDPAWLEPEWLPLAPAMQDYWRRRRRRRHATLDPQPRPDAAGTDQPTDACATEERAARQPR